MWYNDIDVVGEIRRLTYSKLFKLLTDFFILFSDLWRILRLFFHYNNYVVNNLTLISQHDIHTILT